jgi:SAM-dependent methyltransferase
VSGARRPEFGRRADDYRRYRAGFPDSLFTRLAARGIGTAGQRVIDLGTGTGTLARGFALRGASALGIDPDARMLSAARQLDAELGAHVEYRQARAEGTGLDAHSADAVSAGQCWHWFDRLAAAREVARILRPNGWLVLAHLDWIPRAGNAVETTERVVLRHAPDWQGAGGPVHYPWEAELRAAGYCEPASFAYEVSIPYSHEAWRGRVRTCNALGAVLSKAAVDAFDAELAAVLAADHRGEPLQIPHRVWALLMRAPSCQGASPG